MKNNTLQLVAMRDLFKAQMQTKNWSYTVLAQKIQVSVPTVKRWMTKDDIPFEKVLEILEALDLSLADLSQALSFEKAPLRPELKKKEEDYLAQHPKEAYVLLLLSLGFQPDEIRQILQVSLSQLDKIFLSLEKNNLIAYSNSGRIRSLIRPPIRWSPKGAFARRYFPALLHCLTNRARFTFEAREAAIAKANAFLEFGEVYMSEELGADFQGELKSLVHRFRELSRLERQKISITLFQPVSYALYAEPFSSWKQVMWDS